MQTSLAAANEELTYLNASKDILAARHELQHELAKAREMVGSEQLAAAATAARSVNLRAADTLASVYGTHLGTHVSPPATGAGSTHGEAPAAVKICG